MVTRVLAARRPGAQGPLRFSGCALDIGARRLFRGGRAVHCSPKALDTLVALIDSRPRALSKSELLERIWPGVNVSDVSVARVVSEIRRALNDDRTGRIIRTVHSYGYAFAATVEGGESLSAGDPRRHLAGWLISTTHSLPVYEGDQIIGRAPEHDISLDSSKVSRRHARIRIRGGEATVEDLGSKNGSFVRNVRIDRPTRLVDGDDVRFGLSTFVFRVERSPASTETA